MKKQKSKLYEVKKRVLEAKWKSLKKRRIYPPRDSAENLRRITQAHIG